MKVLLSNGYKLHISDCFTAKMKGVCVITTSCLKNSFCKNMRKNGIKECICKECYAEAPQRYKKNVREAYIGNNFLKYYLLNDIDLEIIRIAILNSGLRYLRFESHGELETLTQYINYIGISKALENDNVNCALWTKNLDIIKRAITAKIKKPNNFNLVLSTPFINDREVAEMIYKLYKGYCDKVFTVYNADYIKRKFDYSKDYIDVDNFINCGTKKCNLCGLCYTKNDTIFVNEMLKKDTKKYNDILKYYYNLEQ